MNQNRHSILTTSLVKAFRKRVDISFWLVGWENAVYTKSLDRDYKPNRVQLVRICSYGKNDQQLTPCIRDYKPKIELVFGLLDGTNDQQHKPSLKTEIMDQKLGSVFGFLDSKNDQQP